MADRTYSREVFTVEEMPAPEPPKVHSLLELTRSLDPGQYCISQYQGEESARSAAAALRRQVEEAELAITVAHGPLPDGRWGLFVDKL